MILVYQRTNSDPTAEKLQYVGETTIGAGNTYHFTYRPKSDPTVETGDFIVSLAMEGATRIINVAVEEAPKPVYKVKFMADGQVISEQKVLQNQYVCAIVDFANEDVRLSTYMAGDPLGTLPELQAEGKVFKGWYEMENGQKKPIKPDTVVTGNMMIIADWEAVCYKVEFLNGDGTVLSTQSVAHGTAAQLPDAVPTCNGMNFAAWSTNVNWWEVTGDVQVEPVFRYPKTVEPPVIMNGGRRPANIIDLVKPNQDTKIFYSIRNLDVVAEAQTEEPPVTVSEIPMGFDAEYDPNNPIEITGDVELKLLAVAPNQNDSETVIVQIPYQDPMELTPYDQMEYELHAESVDAVPCSLIEVPVYLSSLANLTGLNIYVSTENEQYIRWIPPQNAAADAQGTYDVMEDHSGVFPITLQVDSTAPAGSYAVSVEASAVDSQGQTIAVRGTTFTVEVAADTSTVLTGSVRSYNPGAPIRIELQQNGVMRGAIEIPAQSGTGMTTCEFSMKVEIADVYDLVITKDGHLPVIIRNVDIHGGRVDLSTHKNPQLRLIVMAVGDLNDDGLVDKTDRNLLWNASNFNRPAEEAANAQADLNADGKVDEMDLSIFCHSENYNTGKEDFVFDYSVTP